MTEQEKNQFVFKRFCSEQEPALLKMLKDEFRPFLENGYWAWKHKMNPNFDPSMIAIAELNNQVVGCNHWMLRNLKLSDSLNVKAVLATEVLVHPKLRGQGLGTQLLRYMREKKVCKEKGVVLSYMFTNGTLNKKLYGPSIGYIPAPRQTATYKKFFSSRILKEKIQDLNNRVQKNNELRKKIENMKIRVAFDLRGAPPFTIQIEEGQIKLEDNKTTNPDVLIQGKIPFSYSIFDSNNGIWGWAKSWVTGQLKIKKGFFKILKLMKTFKVMRQAITNA